MTDLLIKELISSEDLQNMIDTYIATLSSILSHNLEFGICFPLYDNLEGLSE